MKRFATTFAVVATLAGATGALAAELTYGGVQINGRVDNYVDANRNLNLAYGSDARAFQSIGTLHSGTVVTGSLYNSVYADENANIADGDYALACQSIGSIGEFEACKDQGYDKVEPKP